MRSGTVKFSHIKANPGLPLTAEHYLGDNRLETEVCKAEQAIDRAQRRLAKAQAALAADRERVAELERTGAVVIHQEPAKNG